MPKSKGKIPRITFPAIQIFNWSGDNWKTIEGAYGRPIPQKARSHIETVTAQFLQLAQAEQTGSMGEAIERLMRIRSHGQSLIAAIEAPAGSDVTRNYVDDELADSNARLNSKRICKILGLRSVPLAREKYVETTCTDFKRFVTACDLALKKFDYVSKYNYWPTGGAWEIWIRQLSDILAWYGLPTGARKDTDKTKPDRKSDKASPFVKFVEALQKFVPEKYRRATHSTTALAVAIGKARKESKPPVAPRKTRTRKSGRKNR